MKGLPTPNHWHGTFVPRRNLRSRRKHKTWGAGSEGLCLKNPKIAVSTVRGSGWVKRLINSNFAFRDGNPSATADGTDCFQARRPDLLNGPEKDAAVTAGCG